MRLLRLRTLLGVSLVVLSASVCPAWQVTVLHPTPIGSSFGQGIAGSKQAGYGEVLGQYHALAWNGSAEDWIDLNPEGSGGSVAFGCSSINQVGWTLLSNVTKASLWSGIAASWVNLAPAGSDASAANGTSGPWQVGYVSFGGLRHAAKWSGTAASWIDLHPNGAEESEAFGVSSLNQAGSVLLGGVYRGALWTGNAASWIDLHPSGATQSVANATSGPSQVGQVAFGGPRLAALWSGSAGSYIDLHPSGAASSQANGVADPYQVGWVSYSVPTEAVIWSGTKTSMVNLHDLLPIHYSSSVASSVSVDGSTVQVFGYGYNENTNRTEALLWTNVEPDSFTFTFNKSSVAGQNSVLGTITVSSVNGSSRVFTTYDNSSLVTTPATVTVPAGATTKSFQITTTAVNTAVNTLIYAKRNYITQTRPLTLSPLVPTALAFTPVQVTGGQIVSCRVVINGVAGPSGRVISVFDNSANATMPSTVTVPPGASQVTFEIATTTVTSLKTVIVTARVSAGEKSGSFRIAP